MAETLEECFRPLSRVFSALATAIRRGRHSCYRSLKMNYTPLESVETGSPWAWRPKLNFLSGMGASGYGDALPPVSVFLHAALALSKVWRSLALRRIPA